MNSVVFYISAFVVAVIIIARIPGSNYFLAPMFAVAGKISEFVFEDIYSWVIWAVKKIVKSHQDIFYHLTHEKEDIDIAEKVRGKKLS